MKNTKLRNISSPKLTAIDLFCGCGGMTEGLKQAGFQVLWGNDVAAHPLMAYRANHPEVLVDEKGRFQSPSATMLSLSAQ